jgi:cytochrome d ubiquinol oxidase subunit II
MPTVWFIVLALMITMYVVLDGYDLGAGALHRLAGRDEAEREQTIQAIGPVWNGNEVWLIAGGGVLFLAFPRAYAGAFSGLYFGLILVLWLLIGRGLGIELRDQVDSPLWRAACDTVFWLASAALAFVLGVALGNVIRGVPLTAQGYFHMAFFDILNWYALLVGAFGVVLLAGHGATWLAGHTTGPVARRARRWAPRLWWGTVAGLAILAPPTHAVRQDLFTAFAHHPWILVFPLLTIVALVAELAWQRTGDWRRSFRASAVAIVGMLATVAAGLYPKVLPAHEHRPFSLTIHNAASSNHALTIAIVWWSIAITLAVIYFAVVYRLFFGEHARTRTPVS